ncbi:MAG: hypothetical protein ACRDRH_18480 [Pseudonocardia sp.]
MTLSEDEIMRRRKFLATALTGLAVPRGVLDSAARVRPPDASGSLARQVAELEGIVHARALDFPTTPTIDQFPRLVSDYAEFRRLSFEVGEHQQFRVEHGLSQLCAFIGANAATWQDYDAAYEWYRAGLEHAECGQARESAGWIAARSTLLAVHQRADEQVLHDAAYAVMLSPRGQLGSTLGNALAASTLARMGHRTAAYQALDAARRAVDAQADQETFTAYSMPWYRLGRFASEMHTQLGDFERARSYQDESLPAYPAGAATDTTFLRLDRAEAIVREGYPHEGAEHATAALLALSPEQAVPILADRAEQVAEVIDASGFDSEHLRSLVRDVRMPDRS